MNFDIGKLSFQNTREYNEDRETVVTNQGLWFLGVFDGHGGSEVSELAHKRIPEMFFREYSSIRDIEISLSNAHLEFNKSLPPTTKFMGSTSTTCVIDPVHKMIYACNLGDSRSILVRGETGEGIQMTRDHSALIDSTETIDELREMGNEIRKLEAAGAIFDRGYITDPVSRIGVNMTRALGDHHIPGFQSNSIPDLTKHEYKQGDVLLLACDGVWNSSWTVDRRWVDNKLRIEEEIIPKDVKNKLLNGRRINLNQVKIIQRPIRKVEKATSEIVGEFVLEKRLQGLSANEVAKMVVKKSVNSEDNITTIIVYL